MSRFDDRMQRVFGGRWLRFSCWILNSRVLPWNRGSGEAGIGDQ